MKKNDLISDSSVNSRKEETEQILEEVFRKNPHLLSRGARTEIRKIKAGFLVLAIATIVGIWAFTARADRNLRHEINSYAESSCIASRATLGKYNDLVNSILQTREQSLALSVQQNNKQQEKINRDAIIRYSHDKLLVRSIADCKKPIIRP